MSKPLPTQKGEEAKPPSVEDYVDLLHRHQQSTHKFLHQIAKNGKEVVGWWREYLHMAAAQFRVGEKPPPSESVVSDKAAAGVRKAMEEIFAALPADEKGKVKTELDAHQKYLNDLHAASASRISAVIRRTHSTPYGPGAYLARWQNLLDSTLITPGSANGPVRHGANKSVKEEARKDIEGNEAGFVTEDEVEKVVDHSTPDPPSVETTLSLFMVKFREALVRA